MCLKCVQVWSVQRNTSCPHRSNSSSVSLLPRVLCLQHLNEPITKRRRKPSGPLRNMTVCWSPWKQTSCFASFVRKWILLSASPSLSLWLPLTSSALFSSLSANFSPRFLKEKVPVHLLLIYLGHACENGSVLCGSRRVRIRERGWDCSEIKPLKVMPCLIFRATNEQSGSHSQTSSQAAIIPGRGSVLGRQKGGNVTSPDVPALWRRCV